MTVEAAYALTVQLVSVGIVVGSIEAIATRHAMRDASLLSWPIGQLRSPLLVKPPLGPICHRLLGYPAIVGVHAAQLLLAVLVILDARRAPALVALAALHLVVLARSGFGGDGADQMTSIIVVPCAAAICLGDRGRAAALTFIAAQLVLSYVTAGVSKLRGREWRDGTGIAGILATDTYGHAVIGRWVANHRTVGPLLSWTVILWESTTPALFLLPATGVAAALAVGVCFHLTNAIVLGLNTFLWSFVAAYPALLWLAL
jgi:hypothetical protein